MTTESLSNPASNTMDKKCFKCGEIKPLGEFYKHPGMVDGHLNKCKECGKKDVRENYQANKQHYKKYDRRRNQKPDRKKYNSKKSKDWRLENPARSAELKNNWIKNNELKRKAHIAVGNAIRDGKLKRVPCQACGDPKSEAHHHDYSKPLDVVWLCDFHHKQEHMKE